jgi:N-acetylmuramoyl-L-alanine amidase
MSAQLYFDHERRINRLYGTMAFLLILISALIYCIYVVEMDGDLKLAEQKRDDLALIESLKSENEELASTILRQQDEVQAYEDEQNRKKKDEAAKQKKAQFLKSEVSCLADNIYHEAAYEPESGQLAVATVTMNRVANPIYPKTICGVVYERHIKKSSAKIVCMFSWTCKPRYAIHQSLYQKVLQMARAVYFKHLRNDEVQDAVLYHASYIQTPDWANPTNMVAQIGQHLFYRQ